MNTGPMEAGIEDVIVAAQFVMLGASLALVQFGSQVEVFTSVSFTRPLWFLE